MRAAALVLAPLAVISTVTAARAEIVPSPLAVRTAVAIAVRHNPALAALGAEVEAADAAVLAARGADDFVWDAQAGFRRDVRDLVAGVPVQQPLAEDLSLATALTRPLPTGGRLGLRLGVDALVNEYRTDLGVQAGPGDVEVTHERLRAPRVELFGAHPLLRGFGVDIARADRRRARAARDVAGFEREAQAAVLVRDLVASAIDLGAAREEREIRQSLTESARQQLAAVLATIEVGKLPRSASAEVEVAVSVREDEAVVAEQAVHAQEVAFCRLLGSVAPPAPGFAVTGLPEATPAIPDDARTVEDALAHNPQLLALRARGAAASIEIDVAENGRLPALDVSFAAGAFGSAAETPTALRQLRAAASYDVTVGLSIAQPIRGREAEGRLGIARAALHKARFGEADLAAQIRAAALDEVDALALARRRLGALAATIDAATLDLAAERARFEVGRASNFDVLRRQEELGLARLRVLRAKVDWQRARTSLAALTADILPDYGVVIR